MSDPRPLRTSLDAFARATGAPNARALEVVFARWAELVGPAVAAHASPVSLRDGVLSVAVDDPAWATAVRTLSAEVLRRVAECVGEAVATRVDVCVRRPR